LGRDSPEARAKGQKFFGSFFQKRTLFLHTSRDCVTDAAMNPANSGCGANGFDFSSG
jgi:hypothetical protein